MNTKERFIKHYENGYMPWNHEKADFNLVETVKHSGIKSCKVLEIGCGTGTDAIWLSKQGFDVIAIDVSPIAIDLANQNALSEKTSSQFLVLDFLKDKIPAGPYEFVFDRGYFHSFKTVSRRKKIAEKIAQNLTENGLWLSLIGNSDGPPRDSGPPKRTATQILKAIEPYFELQLLKQSVFGNDEIDPAMNWVCLMKKRRYTAK